jgi:hypothetical protein
MACPGSASIALRISVVVTGVIIGVASGLAGVADLANSR